VKLKIICLLILFFCINTNLFSQETGIQSLKLNEILEYYNESIDKLRELELSENSEILSDNRIRINYLNRHIVALKSKTELDISEHLKSIYKDSIIILYEELNKLQTSIISDNINSIDNLSIYLAQFKNKKQSQDDVIDDIGVRVENMKNILNDISETFDSYDLIIEKQNELIIAALELEIEAYRNTIFLTPGVEAAENLTPYISLGVGYISSEGRFSYGGILEAGYSPTQDIVNVGVSVMLGFNFGRIDE
jgi:hypothetical protein